VDRSDLLEVLEAGLVAADGRRVVRDYLSSHRPPGPMHLIAVGKAAAAMTLGALDVLGADITDSFVVIPDGQRDTGLAAMPHLHLVGSAHPIPDARSTRAGAELLAWIGSLPPGAAVVVLISGGASSLVEVLRPGTDPEVLPRLNRWLLGSGLDIFGMNAVRRRVSRIKDGGLAAALWGRAVLALYLSDVNGDDPAWIGSGLLGQAHAPLPPDLPAWIIKLAGDHASPRMPSAHVEHVVVGNLDTALVACQERGRELGYTVTRHGEWLAGPVTRVAARIVAQLEATPPGLHLWGGEPTVILPDEPGRGGRNQHLALCCAMRVAGRDDIAALCVATDGVDGNSEDAGALVDGGTIQRGVDGGADPARCLAGADSATFLEAAGDLVYTGPTGTNVNDIVIGLKSASG
jgi:glycerate 2-kinase